jgi:uncharacterized protein (TIGR03086 family)
VDGSAAALHGGVALLERAVGYALGSLALVTPQRLAAPTPCAGWDVRALLLHVDDGLRGLSEAARAGRVELPVSGYPDGPPPDRGRPAGGPSGTALVAAVRDGACRLIGSWVAPGTGGPVAIADRELTAPVVAVTGAVEIAVHGWDLARGCGADRPLPPSLADELLPLAGLLVGPADRPGRFAPPVALPPGAGPAERLLAFLGRSPR